MKNRFTESIRQIGKNFLFSAPSHLAKNIRAIDEAGRRRIEQSIKENYLIGWRSERNYSPETYRAYLKEQLSGRLESDRREVIPWLDNAASLSNKSILEIGCGTGSSTVALAEQGARITGIDIDEGALLVARERAQLHGVAAHFQILNAKDLAGAFPSSEFEIIIFFACLEHMTIAERLASLRAAWAMLPVNGLLVIVETPNRLWYFDSHTSRLPFFNWLPDELAFAYAQFSSAENFRELYNDYNPTSEEHFLRRGRGVSFHEFDIAIGKVADLKVVSSLSTFEGIRFKLKKSGRERQYKSMLMSLYPDIHEGFFDDTLYLIIRKG